jgi:hypothetical protein
MGTRKWQMEGERRALGSEVLYLCKEGDWLGSDLLQGGVSRGLILGDDLVVAPEISGPEVTACSTKANLVLQTQRLSRPTKKSQGNASSSNFFEESS